MPDYSWGDGPPPEKNQRPESEDPWGDEQRPDPRKVIKQGGPNGGELSRAFKWSFFPVLGLSLASLLGGAFDGIYYFWFFAALYAFAILLLGLVLGLAAVTSGPGDRSGATAAGLIAGAAVGVIALAVTCFVNLSTWNLDLGSS